MSGLGGIERVAARLFDDRDRVDVFNGNARLKRGRHAIGIQKVQGISMGRVIRRMVGPFLRRSLLPYDDSSPPALDEAKAWFGDRIAVAPPVFERGHA